MNVYCLVLGMVSAADQTKHKLPIIICSKKHFITEPHYNWIDSQTQQGI